jgi:MFS family permease
MTSSTLEAPGIFYGWYVVAGTFIVLFLGFGAAYSFAAFFPPLRDEFDATRGDTSLVFSIAGFLYFSLGAITGPLADRFGPKRVVLAGVVLTSTGLILASQANALWQVYLTYSLGVGVGVGFAYVPAVGTIQRWFVVKRGSASGLAVAGIGAGTLVMPLAAAALIEVDGWRTAYLVIGVLTLAGGIPAAMLLEHSPARRSLQPDGAVAPLHVANIPVAPAGHTLRAALRERNYWLLYMSAVFCGLGLFIPFVHLVPYAKDNGIGSAAAAFLVGMIGIGSTLGRLAVGPLADRLGRHLSLVASFAIIAITLALWPLATAYIPLLLFAFVFGTAYGGFVALVPAFTADLYGGRSVGAIIGVLYTGAAFGALIGPPLAGAIYDVRDSYTLPIMFAALANVVATVLTLMLKPPARAAT